MWVLTRFHPIGSRLSTETVEVGTEVGTEVGFSPHRLKVEH